MTAQASAWNRNRGKRQRERAVIREAVIVRHETKAAKRELDSIDSLADLRATVGGTA